MLNCVVKSFPNICACFVYISCWLTISSWLLGHPEWDVGLCCTADVIYFFSLQDLRAPSTDRRETVPRDGKYVQFCNPGPQIWGALPQKIWGQEGAKFGVI